MPNPLPALPPLYPAGANAPAGSLPIAPPQVPTQSPAQVVVAPQAPAPVPYAQASTGHAGADAILAAAHANGVVGWTPPAAPTVAPPPATAGDLQNAYQKAGGVTITPAPSDPITPQVPLDTASPTMSSNASSRITAAAQSLVGSYCGPAGCANAVNKIAKIAGIPVPKTASAGDFEKGLANPKSGWVQVPASEADSAQIVTMKGGGGPNNPSGRHVEVHIGGGRTVGDPGRSSGYKIVTGKLPTNDPSAKFWKYAGDMSGPITHSPTAPAQTGTDQYGEPTFVKPTGEINGAYPGHVPSGASHDIVAGPTSNIGAPPIAAHHSQVQPRAANGTFKPAPPEPPSGNNSFQEWLNNTGEEIKAGASALPGIGHDIARGAGMFPSAIVNGAKAIPGIAGHIGQQLGQWALSNPDMSADPDYNDKVHVNPPDVLGIGAAKSAVGRATGAPGDVMDKTIGPNSLPAQVSESMAKNPVLTTAAITGGFGGASGALGLGAKLAGPGALGDALASEAASAKFFADPLNVHGAINNVAQKVKQSVASARVNPAPGDFVQSTSNPNKFGRVVNTTGSGVTKSYTVETPSGQQKVAWHDIGRHADAANVNEFVANNPGAERAFGVKNQSGRYQFRPGHSMQEEPSTPSAAPAEPPASAAAPPRLLPAPTEPAAPTAAPSSPPVAPAAPAGPAAPASPVVQAASPVTIPSVPPPVAAATPNVPAPAPALTVASTIAPVAAAAIARPIGTPLKLSGTKNAPTLQTLPTGPFEPTVSKAFSKTGGMRTGSQKHTQTFVLVGKPNPSANGGVQATHVVIAAKSAPEASAPAAALPVWSVYNVDPQGKSMLPGTSVGLGDVAATGLTRKDAVAQAKGLSAKYAVPAPAATPTHGFAPPPVTPEAQAAAQAFRAKQAAPAAIPEPLHESVPASAPPAGIMPPRPVVAQAKAEKADPRTGMTPTQSAFLVDSLKKAIPNLPEKADAAISTRDKYGTVSGSRTLDAPTNITIQVPGDGRFTIGGQDQAKALIDRLGQPAAPATRNYNQRPPRLIPKPSDEGYDAHIHNEKEVARAKAAKSNGIKSASAPTVGKKTERGAAVIRTPNLGPQVEKAKGWIKDTHAKLLDMTEGNLHMLGLHASPESYMAANALAGAHGPVKIVADAMHRIGEIAKPIGGVNTVHDVLFSSNLRGKAHNWRDLAADAQTKPVTYQANPSAPTVLDRDMADMLGKLEETDPAKHQHTKTVSAVQHAKDLAAQAGETGNDKPLRNYLTKKFKDGEDTAMAAARAIMPDSEYHHTRIHPLYKEAKEIWKSDISPVFTASHASNEGVFQGKNRLGEEGVYVPTIPADANGDPLLGNPGASNPAFSSPSNRSNHYATGQSAHYDHSLPTLRNKLLGSIKRNAQADLFKKLTADGTMQHPSQGLIETGHGGSKRTLMTLKDGTVHEATSVPINTQGDRMIIPTAIKHELAPILGSVLPDWGSSGDVPDNAFTHFMDFINGVGLSGATTMAYHDQNLFSVLADELTRSMGIPGAAVNTVPFAPRALALRKASMMRGGSKNSRILDSELAKAGGLPTEYATQTLSKEYAANTGANFAFKGITRTDRGRLEPPKASLSPVLFGPSGVDIHVRRSLWDIARMENGIKPGESMLVKPGETIIDKHTGKPKNVGEWKDAEKAAACLKTVSRVGRYILSVDSQIVRFLKKWHVNPAAEAGMTMLNNQVRYLHPRNFIRGLAASILGYMLFYKVWHGHFFGENGKTDGNRFGEVSVKYNRQAYHPNVLAMMNPMYNRALKSSGISGAIDAKMNGGNDRQVIEGGELGPLNEGLRMGASGPFVGGFMRTALGVEPYITQITNRRTGKPDIGMYPAMGKVPNDAPGWAKAHLMSAIEGGNPTLQLGEQVLGLGHEGEKTRDLPPEGRAAVALGSLLGVPIRGPQKGGKPIMPRDRGSGMGLGSLGKMRM